MKTTKQNFELFQEEFWHWVKIFGLLSWEYFFTHGKTELMSRAEVDRNFSAKLVTVTLDNDWSDMEVTHELICKTAFHEAMEIKYAHVSKLLEQFYNEDLATQFIHDLIRMDENAIFIPYYEEKYK